MRIVSFEHDGGSRLGVRQKDQIIDLKIAQPSLPTDLADVLRAGLLAEIAAIAKAAPAKALRPADTLVYKPLTVKPGKVLCLGVNYVDHAAENKLTAPTDYPVLFMRGATSFVAHGAPIVRPACSEQLDFEGELACFVGKTGRHISRDNALDHVAGYSVFNDASIRDYQLRTMQWTVGKNFDDTGAFGPDFVTADELPPGAKGLKLETRLNGVVVQSANTREMVFDVVNTIALISEAMTLEAGDVLIMGTPAGVGMARTPQLWMKPGDVCEVEIEKIGILRNPIVAESG